VTFRSNSRGASQRCCGASAGNGLNFRKGLSAGANLRVQTAAVWDYISRQVLQAGDNSLNAKRRFETLSDTELHHLMRLALEGGLYANADTHALGEFLGTLAADVGFELWLRDQRRTEVRWTRARPPEMAYSKARARTH
jgi:hypothetical protein